MDHWDWVERIVILKWWKTWLEISHGRMARNGMVMAMTAVLILFIFSVWGEGTKPFVGGIFGSSVPEILFSV